LLRAFARAFRSGNNPVHAKSRSREIPVMIGRS
jgi:hypothetical protein